MNIPSPRSARRARIEIIPLIDIIFFLLATFVLVSLSMVKSNALPVNLPQASTASSAGREEFTTITIDSANQVHFNRRPIGQEELPSLLAALKAEHPAPMVHINGDAHSELGTTIAVLDAVRRSGIVRIAFETRPTPK